MRTFIRPRLRLPLWTAVAGLAFAAAWLVRGGPLWWVSIMAVIGTAVRAFSVYRMGGTDTDEGALVGSRSDERQQLISLRSRALGWNLAMVAAFIGMTIAVAVKGAWWWPFGVTLAVGSFGYLLGLSNYGVAEEGASDDAETGQWTQPPVSR